MTSIHLVDHRVPVSTAPASPFSGVQDALRKDILAKDSEYQQSLTDEQSYTARIQELQQERATILDMLCDLTEEDARSHYDASLDCDFEIAVLESKLRKLLRERPGVERQAVERKIASLESEIAELNERTNLLKIDDDTIEKFLQTGPGDLQLKALYEKQNEFRSSLNVLGDRSSTLNMLKKLLLRYDNDTQTG